MFTPKLLDIELAILSKTPMYLFHVAQVGIGVGVQCFG
jgi:hypothetical protein|tara:strand:- start:2512 stop:2625 length:114 start_codon:yes stop_codon:yes gene_type:complete